MARTPEKLLVISAEPTNQWGKQKIMVQNAAGEQYQLHLGEKSGKMPAGQLNVEQMFEVWLYRTPKGADMMCGNLYVPGAPQTPSTPQTAPARPPAVAVTATAAPPVNRDRLIVTQVVYKEFSAHFNELLRLPEDESEMRLHVDMIFRLANPSAPPSPAMADPEIPF